MFHLEKAWSAHHTKTKTLFAITEYQLGPHVIVIVPLTPPPFRNPVTLIYLSTGLYCLRRRGQTYAIEFSVYLEKGKNSMGPFVNTETRELTPCLNIVLNPLIYQ